MDKVFIFRFESDLDKAKIHINTLLDNIKEFMPLLKIEQLNEIKLIISELIYNAIIHGNNMDPEKYVILSVELSNEEIIGTIEDEGSGFNYSNLINTFDTTPSFKDRGRGLKIIDGLCDSIEHNDKGNIVSFIKRMS